MDAETDKEGAKGKPDNDLKEGQAPTFSTPRQSTANEACPCCNKTNQPPQLSWWRDSQWWQFIAAAILVPAGIYAALWVYPDQLDEMRKATQAATAGVNLAKDNLVFAQETAHRDQRAWVAPSQIVGKPEEGKPYEITVTIMNTGKTFAREVHAHTGFKRQGIADPSPDFDAELANMTKQFASQLTGTTSLIAPNGIFESTVKVSQGRNLTKHDMLELTAPTTMMFVFGKIRYKDVFNCDHWTRFSVRCFADGRITNFGQYTKDDDNQCP